MKSIAKNLSFILLVSASANLLAHTAMAADAPVKDKQAKNAIETRKAAFHLIATSFKPIGDAVQGKAEFNQADVQKRANRILMLTDFLEASFPESSNLGEPDTKASADIWTKRAEFDKKLKDFQEHAATLAKVAATETSATPAFKEAFGAVGKDCKGCHDSFKVK
jgi:cytochrome c556